MLKQLDTSLFNSSPIPMWVANRLDLSYMEVNNEALKLYGYSREEFMSMNAFDLRDGSDTKFLVEKTNIFKDFKIPEAIHLKKNGERIFVEVTGQTINYNGKDAYLVMAIDITQRKIADEKLKTNQQLLLASQEIAKIGSWEVHFVDQTDFSKNPSFWSDESYRILGYEPGSVKLDHAFFLEHVHPEDLHLVLFNLEKLYDLGARHVNEYRLLLKNGDIKDIHGEFYVIFDDNNAPAKMIGILQDITERKKSDKAIRITQKRLLASQEIAKIGSWELEYSPENGHKLQAIFISDETYRIFGYEPGTIDLNQDIFYKHAHPDDRGQIQTRMQKAIEEQSKYDIEHRIILNNGDEKFLHEIATITYNPETNKLRVIGTCQDITERKLAERVLKENESQLSIAMKIARLGYWEFEVNEGVFTFNDQFYAMLKTNIKNVGSYKLTPDKYTQLFVYPDDQLMVGVEIEKALTTDDPNFTGQIEHRVIFGNGEIGWISVNFYVVKDNQGNTIRTFGVNQDITERKKAEEKLRISQELLLNSESLGKMGSWEVNFLDINDWSKNTATWSDEGYRIFGYEPRSVEVSFPFFLEHVHPEDKHLITDDFKKLFVPGAQQESEFRIILKDGTVKHLHGKFYIHFSDNQVPVKMIGMTQDITERKLAEEKLMIKQQLLLTSQEMGKIGSWEILLEDLIEWENNPTILSDQAYKIFGGHPEGDASFANFMQMVHPEDVHKIIGSPEGFLQSTKPHISEYRIILEDGTVKHIHGKLSVIFDNEKNIPIKLVGVSQDITERKMLEIELENYNQKLEEEIAKQTQELTMANKNLDAFNYSISHDIRTPLRAMEMYIHLLNEKLEKDEENIEYIKKLEMSVNEIKEMISSLLDFAKFSTIELKKENIDMGCNIKNCIELMNKNDGGKDIEFNILETPSISADKSLMKNVFCNLLSNAIKYSSKKDKPYIEISGSKDENYTTYYVKDNGDGFDEKNKSKLFKPFSRLHNESEFEGNGAGLAIVERIISRHGGQIWAEAEKGKGATFYFKLPNSK